MARLLTRSTQELSPGMMTYQLRRLRLRGLITRIPKTNRYEVTEDAYRTELLYVTSLSRVIRPSAGLLPDHNLLAKLRKLFGISKT
ncbi:MAG: hypothetical protein U0941_15785 [Planctomycetaceae bacterium]